VLMKQDKDENISRVKKTHTINKKIKLRSQLVSSAIRSKDLTNNIFQKISIKIQLIFCG